MLIRQASNAKQSNGNEVYRVKPKVCARSSCKHWNSQVKDQANGRRNAQRKAQEHFRQDDAKSNCPEEDGAEKAAPVVVGGQKPEGTKCEDDITTPLEMVRSCIRKDRFPRLFWRVPPKCY